jgi:hypothetical protein
MKRLVPIATILIVILSVAGAVRAQTDLFAGTWKLNVKKSKFTPGPPMKIESQTFSPGPMGLDVSVKCVNADGSTQEFEYTANLDGKSYPITGQGPYGAMSIAANLVASNTIQSKFSKESKVVATATSLVSNSGKVLTISTKGTDANGSPFTIVAVYDKQ